MAPKAVGFNEESRRLGLGLVAVQVDASGTEKERCIPPVCLHSTGFALPNLTRTQQCGSYVSNDPAGFLVYGPYVLRNPGKYRLTVRGQVEKATAS